MLIKHLKKIVYMVAVVAALDDGACRNALPPGNYCWF